MTLYDAVNPAAPPSSARALAGYVDGAWPSFLALTRRFPHGQVLSIATSTGSRAMVLDVEQGNGGPLSPAEWVAAERSRGVRRPCIYCKPERVASLLDELRAITVLRSDIRLWVPDDTGHPHVAKIPGTGVGTEAPGATQYRFNVGRGYDESATTQGWLDAVVYDFSQGRHS